MFRPSLRRGALALGAAVVVGSSALAQTIAKAQAFTVADLWFDGGLVERAQGEWREAVAGRSAAVAGGA